ncbi:alanine racemase [Williamsia sp. CHRR-6]|uniref:alanine racemase n=1 Tax=Williamsia sp. CHRR-6 TaxID=2835871 RepID=UPI001BD99E82|nr:alanine racemase [Williamsia sp. CHRR-6]MBT0566780.1 alanine racemase [Williamsia sp. CHRR-6]
MQSRYYVTNFLTGSTRTAHNEAVDTPYLAVDLARLDANLTRMARWAAHAGVDLRPHAKTHKCAEIAQRQLGSGAIGLTVATIGEAEAFAAIGVDDLFIAYPLWVTASTATRLRAIAAHTSLRLAVDSIDGATALARGLGSMMGQVEVLVELDSGHHRTGTDPAHAGVIAAHGRSLGLPVVGVFTFPGHGYGPGTAQSAGEQESRALSAGAQALRAVGVEPRIRSGGSTPTATLADPDVVTEIRPGVYPFNDAQQVEMGTATFDDVALVAIATVVHRQPHRAVLDCGSKILSADRPPWTTGFGRLPAYPDARVVALSEHHATVDFGDRPAPALGTRLAVAPNHVCTAVNLVDELMVMRDGELLDRWPVLARGANW